MSGIVKYVVITPVRDEVNFIGKTIASMVAQTVTPTHWVIVDDGSTDGTVNVIESMAKEYTWISLLHRTNRGFRKSGGGVIEAFQEGYRKLHGEDFHYIVKLDGDLSFQPDYFKQCFRYFSKEPKLGIGGGLVYLQQGENGLEQDAKGDPWFHVRGATKIYRRECWDAIQPLVAAPGWDTIDELKANMLGWQTHSFEDLAVVQHKSTGAGDGLWRNSVKNGKANYITGYHPLFMALKVIKRLPRSPVLLGALGLAWGYFTGMLHSELRVKDAGFIRYVRSQQMAALFFRRSLWRGHGPS